MKPAHEPSGAEAELAERIGGEECGLQRAHLRVGKVQLALNVRRRDGKSGAVDVVDGCRERQQDEDAPFPRRERGAGWNSESGHSGSISLVRDNSCLRLPIDPLIPEILDHLRAANTLVLEAPPGAGKTTRVPPALLGLTSKDVLVLEPRRLAARLAARFVAAEIGERVGETVGYQVRFEEVAGPRTRLRFLTEGVLTRRLMSDPQLERVGCVVLDEFHERHLEGDLALALRCGCNERRGRI